MSSARNPSSVCAMPTKQKKNKLPAWQTGKTVTRPGTSNPTALLVFLEGFRLFAERDKFFDLCFAFPGKEVYDCFRDCLIYHFRENGGVHADIQFFGDKDHRFKFRITLAGLQIYDRAGGSYRGVQLTVFASDAAASVLTAPSMQIDPADCSLHTTSTLL